MTENELKAKALIIGIKLKKLNWFEMTGTKAFEWCCQEAKKMDIKNMYLEFVALSAMNYVIS